MKMSIQSRLRQQLRRTRIGDHDITVWDHWPLYLDPDLTKEMVDHLQNLVCDRATRIDYLCPIPRGGMLLAASLAQRLQVPLLAFWWGDGILAQERVNEGAHIVLFDTDIKTGRALHFALAVLETIHPSIECLITVIYHDQYPAEFTMPIKVQWFEERKIISLYRMSELLE
jgi:hypoxanthine phosphoribosyltransferase